MHHRKFLKEINRPTRWYQTAFSFNIEKYHSMRTNLTSFQCHYVPNRKVQISGNQRFFIFSYFSSLWNSNNQLQIDSILNKWLTYQKIINNKHREKKNVTNSMDIRIGQIQTFIFHISFQCQIHWENMQNAIDWNAVEGFLCFYRKYL